MDFAIPPDLSEWQERVREFVRRELQPHDEIVERTGQVPASALEGLRRMGLFGTNTPREYGGLGHPMLASCLATEELAKAHAAFYYLSGVNVHIGSKAIEFAARPEVRDRWLPEIASGRTIAAFALTEPEAGSDVARIGTQARREGAHYVLDGRKTYVTNAAEAGIFTVFATLDPRLGAKGLCAFAMPADTPGLRVGRAIPMTAGHGSSHCDLVLESCRVPAGNLLGEEHEGFRLAMRCLDAGRTHWGAYCAGAAQHLLDMALSRVASRHTFGAPLGAHQGIQWMLADLAAAVHSARLVAYEAAWAYDHQPERRTQAAAMAKLVGADAVFRVADATLQLFGGSGYSKDVPVERIWREVRVVRILDGTSEMMKTIIGRHLVRDAQARNART
ncbi:MAG: acyl-CoA dehydrogenase family protein [Acetobacteraceae bacterium]